MSDAEDDCLPKLKFDLLRKKLVRAGLSEESSAIAVRIFASHIENDVEVAALARPIPYSFDYSGENLSIYWWSIKQNVFVRDDYTCFYCKADVRHDPTVDHIKPVSKKGGVDYDNLITACRSCNASKRDRDVHEWMASRA
jgi:HNH endonuclease